ncbi:hypothetical protein C8Q76DRAFT_794894 [Earliella scabrosa]|nr:hypothetical protein C8Q76DRAFT_794894 [Earliella scabrosa]
MITVFSCDNASFSTRTEVDLAMEDNWTPVKVTILEAMGNYRWLIIQATTPQATEIVYSRAIVEGRYVCCDEPNLTVFLRRRVSNTTDPVEYKVKFDSGWDFWSYMTHFSNSRMVAYGIVAPNLTDLGSTYLVLKGDLPLGLPLILLLEKKATSSVSVSDPAEEIEGKCHGYAHALGSEPNEPGTIPFLSRSLASTMSHNFLLTAYINPNAPLKTHLCEHSVVSLLTLPLPPLFSTPPLSSTSTYATHTIHLTDAHAPAIPTSPPPILPASPARTYNALANGSGMQSIVVCLSATGPRIRLSFGGAQAMTRAATLPSIQVLRG